MRQLGARLPVPPPAETDVVETPQATPTNQRAMPPDPPVRPNPPAPSEIHQVERYPVEIHRIEPQAVVSGPIAPPQQREPVGRRPARERGEGNPVWATDLARQERNGATQNTATQPDNAAAEADNGAGQPGNPAGRWAEFHESHQLEPGRGSRLNLAPMLQQEDQLWVRPRVEREREHHFPFLTLAVPGIAAILAVGALLWSGSLRDRVHQQDAAMSALQEQNQKLADMLAQMNVDQKATNALNGSSESTTDPAAAAQQNANGTPSTQQSAPQSAPDSDEKAATRQPGQASPQSANEAGAADLPVQKQSAREPGNRQGISTPPPVGQAGRMSRQQNGSRYRGPVDAGYTPELVPPYPTHFQPQNVAANAATSQPVPRAGVSNPAAPVSGGTTSARTTSAATGQAAPQTYVPPVTVPSSGAARSASQTGGAQGARAGQTSAGQGAPPPAPYNAGSAPYRAGADGSYASPLAQNIEAVEGLQRHSPIPLREFHADAGRFAKLTASLGVSVRNPDPGHGTYALVVDEGDGKHYQLAGQVNNPLTLTDNATHREYALVVLRIDNQQVYGYVRPMQ